MVGPVRVLLPATVVAAVIVMMVMVRRTRAITETVARIPSETVSTRCVVTCKLLVLVVYYSVTDVGVFQLVNLVEHP